MNNFKKNAWPIAKGIIFGLALLATAGLMIKVAGLNMLPMKYLIPIILMVVFLLLIIFALLYLLPIKRKNQGKESKDNIGEKETKVEGKMPVAWKDFVKKLSSKHVIRGIGVLLALILFIVDIVGIHAVNKFEETMSSLIQEDTDVEEFVVGVYVRAEDKAENLEDVKRYDLAYSLAYDRNVTKKAIDVMENELDRNLNLEEYGSILEMVDDVLAKNKAGFVISTSYMNILAEQEGYEDISDQVKCIHECVITTETKTVEKEEENFDVTKDPFIVYVSGHDTTFAANRANSDVNIIVVVNPSTKQVLLINTPRDYYVEISVSDEGAKDKLTHCGIYGVDCSMDTLNELYDIDIRYYAQLNFKGFIRLIDAVGGITVYSEKEFYSTSEGIFIQKGTNHLNGEAALEFVRERKQFGDGDAARGRHQMEVIQGIIKKMSSGSLLSNYDDVLDSMGKYFKCNVPQEDLSALVKMQVSDMAEWNVQSYAVGGEGKSMITYSIPDLKVYVMVPDEITIEHAKTLIEKVYEGETIEEEDLVLPEEE